MPQRDCSPLLNVQRGVLICVRCIVAGACLCVQPVPLPCDPPIDLAEVVLHVRSELLGGEVCGCSAPVLEQRHVSYKGQQLLKQALHI